MVWVAASMLFAGLAAPQFWEPVHRDSLAEMRYIETLTNREVRELMTKQRNHVLASLYEAGYLAPVADDQIVEALGSLYGWQPDSWRSCEPHRPRGHEPPPSDRPAQVEQSAHLTR